MLLADLVSLPAQGGRGDNRSKDTKIEIAGLTADSRAVKPGYLFAALPGTEADGARFIREALHRGAVAVVTHAGWQAEPGNEGLADSEETPILDYRNPRRELAIAAARYYEGQPRTICAITGTNGKTSIANFTRQIWTRLGKRSASMGTLGIQSPEAFIPLHHTTPDPVEIHRALNGLALAGVDHLAMEASSHGLAQYRLDGVSIAAAAFTNLTRDHLDYHKDFDDYLFAKMRLIGELLKPGATAVLNIDADFFEEADQLCWSRGIKCLSVGESEGAALRLLSQTSTAQGQDLKISWNNKEFDIALPLVGAFQAMNALMAAALVIATGAPAGEVFETLSCLVPIKGRMQMVGRAPGGAAVLVDYAHTSDALETVLKALRPHTDARLHLVFGCGGDRDRGKRPLMGAVAASLADVAIVTDDNPRGEDPAAIRAEVLAGAKDADHVVEIGDRKEAISMAIEGLRIGDLLIVAGKGHETGQIVGDRVLPFSDVDEVEAVLGNLAAGGSRED
jgi:UDP-N-acetylmuramoyl-L-alanyl-D-glutamate--2,6-diaminopimelate ligase